MAAKDAVTLATVLGQRLLVVPDYQRPYAWEASSSRTSGKTLTSWGRVPGTTRARSS